MAKERFLNQKLGKRSSRRQALVKLKVKTKSRLLNMPRTK